MILGLSTYDRIVDDVAARLQIQDEPAKPIEGLLVDDTRPRGADRYGAFDGVPLLRAGVLQQCATPEL